MSGINPFDVKNDLFSLDNLLHSLVAVAFVCLSLIGLHWGYVPNVLPWGLAVLAGIGLYLREASQVGWDFTLRWSVHKHLEWIVGTNVGFLAALIIAVAT